MSCCYQTDILIDSGGEGTVGSHWEAKYLNHEYLTGVQLSAQAYVSEFTLALMEDSNWYQVDYSYAEPYTWGKDEGCSFLETECISTTTYISNFPQFWCDDDNDDASRRCTADYTAIGVCSRYNYI